MPRQSRSNVIRSVSVTIVQPPSLIRPRSMYRLFTFSRSAKSLTAEPFCDSQLFINRGANVRPSLVRVSSLRSVCAWLLERGEIFADQYEVTGINLTRGQQLTPLLVASHKGNVRIVTLGNPASSELRALAEEGNTAPLAVPSANADYKRVVTVPGLLDPGKSVTTKVNAERADFLTVAANSCTSTRASME